MKLDVGLEIKGSADAVWAAIIDIENAAAGIRGIEKITILERPESGLVGLRWLETRILFDKPATVEKRIVAAEAGNSYTTIAESDGFIFETTKTIAAAGGLVRLTEVHVSKPQTWAARCMLIPMRLFFKGVAKKAVLQDLQDIKAAVERPAATN